MSEPTQQPAETPPLPDLSLYSTPDLAMHLLAELQVRHRRDVLVFVIKRQVDGDRPALFSRMVGDEDKLEGVLSSALRHVRRKNDSCWGPWRGEEGRSGFHEAGAMPGAAADE